MKQAKRPMHVVSEPHRAYVDASRRPRDGGAWYWRVKTDGALVASLWGTRAEVVRFLHDLPTDITPGNRHRDTVRTVRDLLECWVPVLQGETHRQGVTIAQYVANARMVAATIGDVLLAEVASSRTLDRYVRTVRAHRTVTVRLRGMPRQLERRPRSVSSIRLDWIVLKLAWRWGLEHAAHKVALPAFPRLSDRRDQLAYDPSVAEVVATLEHVPSWVSGTLRLQWALGARVGEVLAARVGDVTVRGEELHIEITGKTGARRVAIAANLRPIVLGWLRGREATARLVPETPEAATRYLVSRVAGYVRRGCAAAGVTPWTTHAMRRAAVNAMIDAGIDARVAADTLGHTVEVALEHYRRATTTRRQTAIEAIPALPAGRVLPLRQRGGGEDA